MIFSPMLPHTVPSYLYISTAHIHALSRYDPCGVSGQFDLRASLVARVRITKRMANREDVAGLLYEMVP